MNHPLHRFPFIGLALAITLLSVFGLALIHVLAAGASVFNVTNISDSGPGSLRQALLDANTSPGADLIDITANGTLVLLSPLPIITDSVTIQGPGAGLFAVDGNDSFRVIDIDNTEVTLTDLTIQHGRVSGASEYGGGIRSTGTLFLDGVEVVSNTALSYGGGLYVEGNITMTDVGIRDNESTNSVGGGMYMVGTTVISGTQFTSNSSRGDGGGAFVLGDLMVTDALFQENHCSASSCDGAGLFSFSQTDISDTQFISNTAQDHGGGVASSSVLTITRSVFENNQAVFGTGGGLFVQNMVTIQDTHFLSNTARSSGGGIYASDTADLSDVLFHSNQSTNSSGGGMYASGDVDITRTQFLRNTAVEGGGLSHDLGDAFLENSLFAENMATNTSGMAMLLASAGSVEVLHATIASPAAASGSAIEAVTGSAMITNTIITDHTIGINNVGASVHQDFNLFFENGTDIQGNVTGGVDSLIGDPFFMDPAGDDYHLSLGSAAIDAGTDAGVTTDFDNDARPLDLGFDIGFDEVNLPSYSCYLPLISK